MKTSVRRYNDPGPKTTLRGSCSGLVRLDVRDLKLFRSHILLRLVSTITFAAHLQHRKSPALGGPFQGREGQSCAQGRQCKAFLISLFYDFCCLVTYLANLLQASSPPQPGQTPMHIDPQVLGEDFIVFVHSLKRNPLEILGERNF